jgi:putative salt-induced outer membrane protein YdiY
LSYQNHFKNDLFYYGTFSADYDRPRQIRNRWIPSAGYGYKLKFAKDTWLEPSAGLGYVATTYTDELYPDKDFAAASINLSGKYSVDELPYINSLIVDGFMMYYPSLENLAEDWVLRSNLTFAVPLFDFFSVKLAFDLKNDSNPDPSVGNNKTTTKLLFGLDF